MAFTIQYLRNGREVAETPWQSDIPPSCAFATYGIERHRADTAIIRDELGKHLTVVAEDRRQHGSAEPTLEQLRD